MSRSKKRKKRSCQYPAILTSRLVNNSDAYIFITEAEITLHVHAKQLKKTPNEMSAFLKTSFIFKNISK